MTILDIQRAVAGHYGLTVAQLRGHRLSIAIARPRQIAVYLASRMTGASLSMIDAAFGGRDHSTIVHAVSRIAALRQSDPDFSRDVDTIEASLRQASSDALNAALVGWAA